MARQIAEGQHPLIVMEAEAKQNLQYWENRYRCRSVEWHIEEVHPHLLRYLTELTQGRDSTPLKFFLPLCGKTKDIPFLLGLGYEVFGVEAVPSVIEEFIQENNIKLHHNPETNLYYNDEQTLKIFCGDLFKCPIEIYGPFDCIWDRASLIALGYGFRPAYMEMMRRAVNQGQYDFRYILQSVRYDKTKFGGPPRCVDDEDIKEMYGDWADFKLLEDYQVNEDHPCRQVARATGYFGDEFVEQFHMIQPKSSN